MLYSHQRRIRRLLNDLGSTYLAYVPLGIIVGLVVCLILPTVLKCFQTVDVRIYKSISRVYEHSHRKALSVNLAEVCQTAKNYHNQSIDVPMTVCPSYIFNNPHICKDIEHLFGLIIVNSAPDHFIHRERMRKTLGNPNILPASVRIVFLLGTVSNATLQKQILAEHRQYRDTIQGDFLDTYKNLTLKAVMGLKWITEHCQNVEFVIRLDDDASADIYYLLTKILHPFSGITKTMFCVKSENTPILREEDSKWCVSESRFENMTNYPWTYCIGWAAIMSSDLIPHLYKSAATIPTFWIDDIYVMGILADEVKPVTYYDVSMDMGHNVTDLKHDCFDPKRVTPCLFINSASEFILNSFWNFVYRKRYDYIFTAMDNLDLFEGF